MTTVENQRQIIEAAAVVLLQEAEKYAAELDWSAAPPRLDQESDTIRMEMAVIIATHQLILATANRIADLKLDKAQSTRVIMRGLGGALGTFTQTMPERLRLYFLEQLAQLTMDAATFQDAAGRRH
jgi:hypothetical protein